MGCCRSSSTHGGLTAFRVSLASKKLGFVPAVIEDAGGPSSADGGGDEIVIRTAAIAIHVPPRASEEHIARVLAAVSRSG